MGRVGRLSTASAQSVVEISNTLSSSRIDCAAQRSPVTSPTGICTAIAPGPLAIATFELLAKINVTCDPTMCLSAGSDSTVGRWRLRGWRRLLDVERET